MLLFYSNTSPYSRKVRLVILEKELDGRVDTVVCDPFQDVPALSAVNPLRRVPTLLTDDGYALFDSPVICEFLDTRTQDHRLIPEAGAARWIVRRWEAMADGLSDAAYNIVMERRRPPEQQSVKWIGHWEAEIDRTVQQAEQDLGGVTSTVDLAQIALAAALGYLDFRLPESGWREQRTALAAWYADFAQRPSMLATRPE
jgi:glutathione S-transferase